MPIYEYRCNQCGAEFEEFRSLSQAEEKAKCPQCLSENTERLISLFSSSSSSPGTSCGGPSGIS